MKKAAVIGFTTLAGVSLVFTGCSSSSSPASNSSTQGQSTAATILKVGYPTAENSPVDLAAHKWADSVNQDTNGKVKIELYPNSQLGGEAQMMQNLKIDALDMGIIGDLAFSQYAPDYAGLSMPYLFNNLDQVHKVFAGPIGQDISKEFQKNLNAQVLGWWDRGPRELTANKEIKTPDDLKGLKLRVPEIPIIVDSWKALGANPTPMSFDQLFNALQQHVIDAQENPLDLIYTSKFNEVQKDVMLTDHMLVPFIVFINNDKLNSLPQDTQKILKDDAVKAGTYENDLTAKSLEDYKQKLTAAGMKVVPVDQSLFIKKLSDAKVADKYADKWAPNLLQKIQDTK